MRKMEVVRTLMSLLCGLAAVTILAGPAGKLWDEVEAAATTPTVDIPAPPDSVPGQERVAAVFNATLESGHVCPVGALDEAFTAAHVANSAKLLTWYDSLGSTGVVEAAWVDARRDIAVVRIVQGTSHFSGALPMASEMPEVGDKVCIVGFNPLGMSDVTVCAKVVETRGDIIAYDNTPGPGSSGSCVLNARGEVVGINVAMDHTGNGLGLAIVGKWATPEEFKVPQGAAKE